jgi:hypothetical protein
MDLKLFYQKVRQLAASIPEPHVVIASKETPEGGRAGVLSEVTRAIAAQLIAEGKAELATEEAAKEFRAQAAEARRLAEQAAAAHKLEITLLSEKDQRPVKGVLRKGKS